MLFSSVLVTFIAVLSVFLFNNSSKRQLLEDKTSKNVLIASRLLSFTRNVGVYYNDETVIAPIKYKQIKEDKGITDTNTTDGSALGLLSNTVDNDYCDKFPWKMEFLTEIIDKQNQNEANVDIEMIVEEQTFHKAMARKYFYTTHYQFMCFIESVKEQDVPDRQDYTPLPAVCRKPVYPVQVWSFNMWNKKSWKIIAIACMLLIPLALLMELKVMMTPRKTMKGSLFRKKKMADFLQETPIKTEVENMEKSRVRPEHVEIFNIGSVNMAEHVEKSEEKLEKRMCTPNKKTREENAREVQTLIKTLSQNVTIRDMPMYPEVVFKDFPNLAQFYVNKIKKSHANM